MEESTNDEELTGNPRPNEAFANRLVKEFERASTDAQSIQDATSRLLEKSAHPDIAEEMHILQDLDRLQQTLVDLASIAGLILNGCGDNAIANLDLRKVIKLESLHSRIFSTPQVEDKANQADDVSWF